MFRKRKVIIILGPTSSGKSDLSVKLAKRLKKETGKDSEIISVDSRQIYKDMNLGTGKVEGVWKKVDLKCQTTQPNKLSTFSKKVFMYKNVSHHIIDFLEPTTHSIHKNKLIRHNNSEIINKSFNEQFKKEKYNVINFRKDCLQAIDDISTRDNIPIICGGTGFWISAVIDNKIFPQVKPNEKLRKKLEPKTNKELFTLLKKKDPSRAKNIDFKNKYRLIRALEICDKLGKVPTVKATPPKDIEFLQIGLDYPVEKLAEKIKKRLAGRWTNGMIEEIKNLKKKYKITWKEIQDFGLAYYWIPLYLQNKLVDNQGKIIIDPEQTWTELIQRVYFAEKNYAKRQRTWFKRDKRIIWTTDFNKILKLSQRFLRNK